MHIDGYQIIRPLARGGAAEVFLAEQTSIGRQVALKVLDARSDSDPELIPRFEREARVIASLQHPNIVPILDFGSTERGYPYYAMPWLSTDLASLDLHQDEGEIRRIIGELCDALHYAHGRDVVHRDIKPANVFVSAERVARLGDFGLALMTRPDATRLTEVGITVGTADYMSPEQALARPMDRRTDIYSLGVVAFELLAGAPPYQGKDAISVAAAHIEAPVPVLPERFRGWQPWVERALAKRPEDRFLDMWQMKYSMPGMPPPTDRQPAVVTDSGSAGGVAERGKPDRSTVDNGSAGPVRGWMLVLLAALILAMAILVIIGVG